MLEEKNKNNDIFHDCDICHASKQSKLPFQSSSSRTQCAIQMLYMDVWGPYHLRSLTGARYFLNMVDDFTRITWTYLLKGTNQVPELLQRHLQ